MYTYFLLLPFAFPFRNRINNTYVYNVGTLANVMLAVSSKHHCVVLHFHCMDGTCSAFFEKATRRTMPDSTRRRKM